MSERELTGEEMFGRPVPGEAVQARPPGNPTAGYRPKPRFVRRSDGRPYAIRERDDEWYDAPTPKDPRMTTTTAIAERPIEARVVTPDELRLVKDTIAAGATDAELKLFLFDCARQGVHPLDRLLHFTKRGGKYTPITSIDFMRIRAAETGEMAGSDDPVFDDHYEGEPLPRAATVTVYRLTQGQRFAYTATARWAEYCPPSGQDHMWRKMPHTMLGKCAEALALRKGFPRQLAGLYAKEEMDQADALPAGSPAVRTRVDPSVGDSGVRPSGAEVLGDAALTSGSIDTTTGEELPPGFARIDAVKDRGAFLDVSWGRDAQGGSRVLTTRVPHIRNAAQAAYDERMPVRLVSKDGKYLDKVERLDAVEAA